MSGPVTNPVTAAAVVPMTPLLFREESGLADPLAELRAIAVHTVRDLAASVDRIVALCPTDLVGAPASYHRPSGPSRNGTGSSGEALSVQLAHHLLLLADVPSEKAEMALRSGESGAARWQEWPHGTTVGLLVLGDGTACRSEAAPGHIDERAFPFDDLIADALEAGDGDALATLDQDLAEQLMVTGRHTFADLGTTLPAARGELRYRDDPYGVSYFVALWQ
jgi:hypothetical protein